MQKNFSGQTLSQVACTFKNLFLRILSALFFGPIMKLKKLKKTSPVNGLDYQVCLDACVAATLKEGPAEAAAIYRSYPTPSLKEWANCQREVANEPSEDTQNPHHLMGCYELRLLKLGFPTALGMAFREMVDGIDTEARKAGVPAEFVIDARRLYFLTHGLSRDEINDH